MLRILLDDFVWQLRKARGYERVEIPHITKKDLYETSGHWEKFKNEKLLDLAQDWVESVRPQII